MESQTAYKLLFAEYPDVVNVEQMCEMLGGICDKTAYRLLKSGEDQELYCWSPLSNPEAQHFGILGLDRKIYCVKPRLHIWPDVRSICYNIDCQWQMNLALYQSKEVLLW